MTGCINLFTEATHLTNSMGQFTESKEVINHNPSFDYFIERSTIYHEMLCDFEKDGISQLLMIDLVGNHLDELVAINDRCQV